MKIAIIFGVICLVLGSDLVLGMPAERQKRWDLFSRAGNWFENAGNSISDAADKVRDFAEDTAARARDHVNQATNHVGSAIDRARANLADAIDG